MQKGAGKSPRPKHRATGGPSAQKNELQPHRQQHGCLGAVNATFVARMEDVPAVYERPHDPRFPVVCFDERPHVLPGQPVEPLPPVAAQPARGEQPAQPGRPRRESRTYVRQGTACLLAAFEPGTGQRLVKVSARRTGANYCRFLQRLAAAHPWAEQIVLVQDNSNTHTDAAFYQHLPAPEARLLAQHGRTRTLRHRPPMPAPAHSCPGGTHRLRGCLRGEAQRHPRHRPLAIYPQKGPRQTRPPLSENQGN